MSTSAGLARTPYIFTVQPRVCDCRLSPKELATGRDIDRIVKVAEAYWSVYLTFFGDQMVWLHFQIVDRRDGHIVWRDGGYTKEEEWNGTIQGGIGTDSRG